MAEQAEGVRAGGRAARGAGVDPITSTNAALAAPATAITAGGA